MPPEGPVKSLLTLRLTMLTALGSGTKSIIPTIHHPSLKWGPAILPRPVGGGLPTCMPLILHRRLGYADYQGGFGSASDSSLYTIDAQFSGTDWLTVTVRLPALLKLWWSVDGLCRLHRRAWRLLRRSIRSYRRASPARAHANRRFRNRQERPTLCQLAGQHWRLVGPSSKGKFPASAPLAAEPQVSLTQTGVFAVNASGTLNVS